MVNALGFKPTITEEPAEPLDKVIIAFFQTQIQVPLAEDGTTITGLWLTATIIVLLFIASISLVIACLGGSPPPQAPKTKKE